VKPYQCSILFIISWLLCASEPSYAASVDTVRVDWAYYNPISLVLKDKKWLEDELASSGTKVEWVQSLGSNKALEFLRGKSIDFGSTFGNRLFYCLTNHSAPWMLSPGAGCKTI
jgi:sulfonate transport system substrate-binding protein